MKIVFGSDHVGLSLKNHLMQFVRDRGHEVQDIGTFSTDRAEYPEYGYAAAMMVSQGQADRAIVICGTGVGISLAANSVPGVRCVVCSEPYTAKMSRSHNDTNALAFGARVIGPGLAEMIVDVWLKESFEGGRHHTRVQALTAME